MSKKKKENPNAITFTLFQKTNYIIGITLQTKHLLGKDKITGVEHSERFYGIQKKRTHNNLFNILKSILVAQDRWVDKETNLGKVREDNTNEIDADDKYGFIYITTNKKNGKRYIGKHTVFDDKYLGSGVLLKKAVAKYGKENFEREDIAFAYDEDELNFLEKHYIDRFNAVADKSFYNLESGENDQYENEEAC